MGKPESKAGGWTWIVAVPLLLATPAGAGAQASYDTRYAGGRPLMTSKVEEWILHYTNAEREAAGLRPFIHDPAISKIARGHSRNMIRLGYAHQLEGRGPTDRALAAGYDCRAYHEDGSYSFGLSENIANYPRITRWSSTSRTWETSVEIVPDTFSRNSQAMALNLVQGWMNSPGHRENILDREARRIGVGVAIQEEKIAQSTELRQENVFATQNFSACQ